jgi:alkanesulfonate monooxygenase SsuD/methylene tetrahydromethanopterin reductase-like flavin-dependent oxidoreductase (luciferase family)
MRHFTYTEAGAGHANEDFALAQPHPADERVLLCALADGQGGRSGGREAAQMAAQKAWGYLTAQTPDALVEPREWLIAAEKADDAVCRDAEAGFTALVLCGVTAAGVWKYAGWAAVESALKDLSGEHLLLHLRDVVKQRNGGILPDDFTAVLLES